jgi:hypothetical protein
MESAASRATDCAEPATGNVPAKDPAVSGILYPVRRGNANRDASKEMANLVQESVPQTNL